jgi:hypothetical protein
LIKLKPLTNSTEWEWFAKRTHTIGCADSGGLVAYDEEGVIHAICVWDSFTVDACSVHFAIDNPFVIRHGFLHEIARHVFITCDRKRIFGLVPSTNEKARKLDIHIGFREVARIPDAVKEGVDYIVLRMDKADCRWLSEEMREAA